MGIYSRRVEDAQMYFEFEEYTYIYRRNTEGWTCTFNERYEEAEDYSMTTEEVVKELDGLTQSFEDILDMIEAYNSKR